MRRMLVVLALALVPACLPEPVYRVQRAARVPHPAAPLRSGAPLAAPVEVSFGASSAFDLRTPRLADRYAAVEVPSTETRSELRFRIGTYGELDLFEAQGVGSTALDRTQAPVPGTHEAFALGTAIRYAIHLPGVPHFFFGLGVEVSTWSVPYVEHRTCVENCDGAPLEETLSGDDHVGSFAYALTPTYRDGPLTLFAGLYAAPYPTITRKGTEIGAIDNDSDLRASSYNYVVHAGLEYKLGPFSVLARIQDDLTRDPVWYGPSFGFALAGRLFDDAYRRPPPPPPPPEPDDRDY